MCLAIYKPKGLSVSKESLNNGFTSNPHGAGFAYNEAGRLVVSKGFFDFESFHKSYLEHEGKQMLIHFRWATHGAKNEFNTHPWMVSGNGWSLAVVHNGILNVDSTEEMSDTGHFVNGWLAPLLRKHSSKLWSDPTFKKMVESYIGGGNKFCMLDNNGKVTIYNEKQGEWNGGIWYSNKGYKPSVYCNSGWCGMDDELDWRRSSVRAWERGVSNNLSAVEASGGVPKPSSVEHAYQQELTIARASSIVEQEEREVRALQEHDAMIRVSHEFGETEREVLMDEEETKAIMSEPGFEADEIEDIYEEYLEEMEQSDPGLYQLALKEISDYESSGCDRLEAMRNVLG